MKKIMKTRMNFGDVLGCQMGGPSNIFGAKNQLKQLYKFKSILVDMAGILG